jgi:hypothetical protein
VDVILIMMIPDFTDLITPEKSTSVGIYPPFRDAQAFHVLATQ